MSQQHREPPRPPRRDPRAARPDVYLPPSPSNRQFTTDGEMPTAIAANFWMPCGVCCRAIEPGETASLSLTGTVWYHSACAERPELTVIAGEGRDDQPTLPLLVAIPGERHHGYPPGGAQ